MITAAAIGVDVFYFTEHHIDYSSRWLARGFAAAAVIYAFSEISGAHADPAVTFGFWLRRVFPLRMTIVYVISQFAGALLAALLWALVDGPAILALGASHPGPGISGTLAAACEFVLTFVLVLVILMTAQEQAAIGKQAALAVGFTVAACGFAAGPISGASMNPARTLAPQLLSGQFQNIWIYIGDPFLGALAAVGVHGLISGGPSRAEERAARGKRGAS
jgi:aquaporin Z